MMTTPASRNTRQRSALIEVMSEITDFRSAAQLHEILLERGHVMGLATVYRNLHMMEARGECDVLRPDAGDTAVYRRCERRAHHHHLVCRSCGHTVEVEGPMIEQWADQTATDAGFTEVAHSVEMFGTCTPCRVAGRTERVEGETR